jgi:hypothetical protein
MEEAKMVVPNLRILVSHPVSVSTSTGNVVGVLVNVRISGGSGTLWMVVDGEDIFVPLAQVTALVAA